MKRPIARTNTIMSQVDTPKKRIEPYDDEDPFDFDKNAVGGNLK